MEEVYAALLLHKLGKEVNEDGVKRVISAAGTTPDEARVKALCAALQGVNIDEAVSKAAAMPAAAPAAAQAGAAPAEKKEEKKVEEEKKEEEAAAGLAALFG